LQTPACPANGSGSGTKQKAAVDERTEERDVQVVERLSGSKPTANEVKIKSAHEATTVYDPTDKLSSV